MLVLEYGGPTLVRSSRCRRRSPTRGTCLSTIGAFGPSRNGAGWPPASLPARQGDRRLILGKRMVYVRGHAHDYEPLGRGRRDGWATPSHPRLQAHGSWQRWRAWWRPDWRGKSGPLHVLVDRARTPSITPSLEAGAQAGYERTSDYNGEKQEGFGPMERRFGRAAAGPPPMPIEARVETREYRPDPMPRSPHRHRRWTGRRVEIRRAGRIETVRARREVIVRGVLDQLAKIADALRHRSGRASVGSTESKLSPTRPGVGQNLQDHLELTFRRPARSRSRSTGSGACSARRWREPNGWSSRPASGREPVRERAFIRSRAGVAYPDIQFHFLPFAVRYDGRAAAA